MTICCTIHWHMASFCQYNEIWITRVARGGFFLLPVFLFSHPRWRLHKMMVFFFFHQRYNCVTFLSFEVWLHGRREEGCPFTDDTKATNFLFSFYTPKVKNFLQHFVLKTSTLLSIPFNDKNFLSQAKFIFVISFFPFHIETQSKTASFNIKIT